MSSLEDQSDEREAAEVELDEYLEEQLKNPEVREAARAERERIYKKFLQQQE